ALLGATRDQAREFHRDHYRPDQSVLVIAGDVDPERAFTAANEWFGRWEGRAKPLAANAVPAMRKGTFLYDLPGSPVTEVRVALLGPGRGDAAHAGWVVARAALENGLLPNEANAALVAGRDASVLVVSASARPESTAAVTLRLTRAIKALGALSATSADWSAARTRAAGEWPLSLETLGEISASWLAGDVAGLAADHLRTQAIAITNADPRGVAAVIQSGSLVLLAGPGDRMKGRLGALGRIDSASVVSRVPVAVAPAGVQVSEEQKKRGAQLVAAAITSHGGAAKLKLVQNSQTEAELRLLIAGQEMTGELRTLRIDPDRLVQVTRILELENRQVLDRLRGWTLSTAGDSATLVDADTSAMLAMRGILESDLVHVLRAATAPGAGVYASGKGMVAGQPVDQVEYLSPAGARTRLSLDAKTRRVMMVESLPTPQGEWRDRRRWPSFQLLEGVWWPSEELREVDGQPVSRAIVRRMQVNATVDSTLFRRPVVARGQVRGLE
ncbi:MAG: insulinase family protein, partial [Candidatus Eisenbacteria bacterium]|nr:insulinase family protein [Candidatus Eisenbacteria bacterium]